MTDRYAYVGRTRGGETVNLQLVTFGHGYVDDVLVEITVLDDTRLILIAEDAIAAVAEARGLTLKARRGNDA